MKVEIGKSYLRNDGAVVKITHEYLDYYYDEDGRYYDEQGVYALVRCVNAAIDKKYFSRFNLQKVFEEEAKKPSARTIKKAPDLDLRIFQALMTVPELANLPRTMRHIDLINKLIADLSELTVKKADL